MSDSNVQFGRSSVLTVSQTVGGKAQQLLDLSKLRHRFNVRASDGESPNQLVVRVYNLSYQTAQKVINEFNEVTLSAGYSTPGLIFGGTITLIERGKEKNTDTFLEITAGDGDLGYNFGFINTSLAPGATLVDVMNKSAAAMGVTVDPNAINTLKSLGGIVAGDGKVMFGLARLQMRALAATVGARWSIQNGVMTLISNTSYLPGGSVVLNSQTGLVGIPVATDGGVKVRCLLNPKIQIGQAIQILETDVTSTTVKTRLYPNTNPSYYPANVALNGMYRVLVVEHSGDTRAVDWYSDLVCLAVDQSANPAASVQAYPTAVN